MLTTISLKVDNTVASMYRGNVSASLLFTYCFLFGIILKQYPQSHKTHRMLLLPHMFCIVERNWSVSHLPVSWSYIHLFYSMTFLRLFFIYFFSWFGSRSSPSNNLVSLSYQMPVFSTNLFRLFSSSLNSWIVVIKQIFGLVAIEF